MAPRFSLRGEEKAARSTGVFDLRVPPEISPRPGLRADEQDYEGRPEAQAACPFRPASHDEKTPMQRIAGEDTANMLVIREAVFCIASGHRGYALWTDCLGTTGFYPAYVKNSRHIR